MIRTDALSDVGSARLLTWRQIDAAVDAVAAGLRGLDLPASDGAPARVAIALPNVPEFATAFFGTLRAGLAIAWAVVEALHDRGR